MNFVGLLDCRDGMLCDSDHRDLIELVVEKRGNGSLKFINNV